MHEQSASQPAHFVDLTALATDARRSGPQWSFESTDLDVTLLTWSPPEEIVAHVNAEVDVLIIAVIGAGEVTVNGRAYRLEAGQALLIPKGTKRAVRCIDDRFGYLSVHRRRRGLWPTVRSERAQ